MGTANLKSGLEGELAHVVKGTDTATINEKNDFIRKMLPVIEAHESVENNINRNEGLSQQGKLEALKKLGTNETAPSLKWLKNVIGDLEAKDQGHRKRFYTIDSGITDVAERMPILVYLWTRLDVLDVQGRVTRFLLAAEQDELVILSAMLTNPEGMMVDEDVKQRGLTERAKRLAPPEYHHFEQNQILLNFLTVARDWIARWLAVEVRVELPVIRANFGDEIADVLTTQVTGIPPTDTQLGAK